MSQGGHWRRLIIRNPTVFVPFLLSTVVMPCTTVKKLFVPFCCRRLWFQVWQWGLIHLGWSMIAVATEARVTSMIYPPNIRLFNQHGDQESRSYSACVGFIPLNLQSSWRVDLAKVISSAPLCSGSRIKSNKTPRPKKLGLELKSWRPLKGCFAVALRGEVISSVALYKPHQMQQARALLDIPLLVTRGARLP